MIEWLLVASSVLAQEAPGVDIESARQSISKSEKQQRETLSHLFGLNQKIRTLAKKRAQIADRTIAQEAAIRQSAQDLLSLERKMELQKIMLNQRLRQLYRGKEENSLSWLFSARTPVELERNHRFLKRMVDADHQHLKIYIADLREVRQKRAHLKSMVSELAVFQRDVHAQEKQIVEQLREKSRFIAELKKDSRSKMLRLKELRQQVTASGDEFAFFERKGSLPAPVDGRITREFGAFVDPQYRFRLMHKGIFFEVPNGSEVRAVASGKVVVAEEIPGYGQTVILDHGDSYYSVYAHLRQLKQKEGGRVKEGELLALSGQDSPLFGPGLHFEIRHFTDAIDPTPWIKEPVIKTANSF